MVGGVPFPDVYIAYEDHSGPAHAFCRNDDNDVSQVLVKRRLEAA